MIIADNHKQLEHKHNSERREAMANKVYDIVKEKILSRLEEAEKNNETFNWVKPWNGGPNTPISYNSGKRYKGINAVVMDPGEYITFKQIQDLQKVNSEVKLKSGSKANQVFFYSLNEKKDEDGKAILDDKGKPETYCVLKYYNVFNVKDVEGLNPRFEVKTYEHTPTENMEAADKYIAEFCKRTNLKMNIEFGSNEAFYRPSAHSVTLPDKKQFKSQYEYYSTVFHELSHSTGEALGRENKNTFGSEKYSKEELVAEISAQMLCNTFGIVDDRSETNSIAYIQGWSEHLKEATPTLIASACISAQKACDLIAEEFYKDIEKSQPVASLDDQINAAQAKATVINQSTKSPEIEKFSEAR